MPTQWRVLVRPTTPYCDDAVQLFRSVIVVSDLIRLRFQLVSIETQLHSVADAVRTRWHYPLRKRVSQLVNSLAQYPNLVDIILQVCVFWIPCGCLCWLRFFFFFFFGLGWLTNFVFSTLCRSQYFTSSR